MGVLIFAKDYLIWHYGTATKEGVLIWKNFIWFISQFFSLILLLRTLFSPWRRLKEYYGRGFDPQKYLEAFFVNLVMRCVGFVLRAATIIIGFAVELLVIFIGVAGVIIWFVLPFFIILSFSRGMMLFSF